MTKPNNQKHKSLFRRLATFIISTISMFLIAATEGAVEGTVEKELGNIQKAISHFLE